MEQAQTTEPSVEQPTSADQEQVLVRGEQLVKLPEDLYIPPDALRVFLETFQGPLDLLLYLIRKQNLDILDIPIAEITKQYMKYIELMYEVQLELAAEYLVMAAMLAEIKSRLLLPKPPSDEEGEVEDPRAELVRRLQEYERFKKAAEDIESLPRLERDNYVADALTPAMDLVELQPQVDMEEIFNALRDVMRRAELYADHTVEREVLSIRERMSIVLETINNSTEFLPFASFFKADEGRMGVVVSLIAVLELIRQSVIELVQAEPFAPIYVKAKS